MTNTTLISKEKNFSLRPSNLEEAYKLAAIIAKTDMVPFLYKNKPDDCLVAIMLGMELGFNPVQSLQHICVINGRPSIWGDGMLALVLSHACFESIDETFEEESMTAICKIKRKGMAIHTSKFSLEDAKEASLIDKKGSLFKQYPKRMLAMRARGFALRNTFADALCGLISAEEAQDIPAEPKIINPNMYAEDKPLELPFFLEDDFLAAFPKWQNAIQKEQHTTESLITLINSRHQLTDPQREKILTIGKSIND